jgi:hypothetical protein
MIAGLSLMLAGIGRTLLEIYFRPDQPSFFGLGFSTSLLVSVLFALFGVFIVLVKWGKISVPFMQPGTDEYTRPEKHRRRAPLPRNSRRRA